MVLAELNRRTDRWEFQAFPASVDCGMVLLGRASRQKSPRVGA
jgi:hypothetical protein